MKTIVPTLLALISMSVAAVAADSAKAEVTRASGGSIRTPLSSRIILNDGSSLNREWIAVKPIGIPATLVGTPGIVTKYVPEDSYSRGKYEYQASFQIQVTEPITAIEVRFITFDVWGERMKSLVLSEIKDYGAGTHTLSAQWNLFSENEAEEFYASIAYVARVRTKDNRVLVTDTAPVLEEARKFYSKFVEADLDPEKAPKTGK